MLDEMDQDDAGDGYASEDVCDINSCIGFIRRSISIHSIWELYGTKIL